MKEMEHIKVKAAGETIYVYHNGGYRRGGIDEDSTHVILDGKTIDNIAAECGYIGAGLSNFEFIVRHDRDSGQTSYALTFEMHINGEEVGLKSFRLSENEGQQIQTGIDEYRVQQQLTEQIVCKVKEVIQKHGYTACVELGADFKETEAKSHGCRAKDIYDAKFHSVAGENYITYKYQNGEQEPVPVINKLSEDETMQIRSEINFCLAHNLVDKKTKPKEKEGEREDTL